MKKKIALLLAFVMLVSLLPMTVFGRASAYSNIVSVNQSTQITTDSAIIPSLVFDPAFYPRSGDFDVILELNAGHQDWVGWLWDGQLEDYGIRESVAADGSIFSIEVIGRQPGFINELILKIHVERKSETIGSWAPIELPILCATNWWDSALRVSFKEFSNGLAFTSPITVATLRGGSGFGFSYTESSRVFSSRVTLNGAISINENRFGSFVAGADYSVTLELPSGFTWERSLTTATDRANIRARRNFAASATSGGATAGGFTLRGANDRQIFANAGGAYVDFVFGEDRRGNIKREVIEFDFPIGTESTIADALRIHGLSIVADDNAKVGDVNVTITLTGPSLWTQGTVTVARYGSGDLLFQVINDDEVKWMEDEDNFIKTGMREFGFDDFDVNDIDNAETVEGGWYDFHKTARVRVLETVPGAWALNGAAETEFTFGEGVQLLGAFIRVPTNNNQVGFVNIDTGEKLVKKGNNDNWHEYEIRYIDGREASRMGPFDALVRKSSLSIKPDVRERALNEADVPSSDRTRLPAYMDIEFFLSVEAGYEQKYETNEIEVTISGSGVDGNTVTEETIVCAYVYDPITVTTDPIVLDDEILASQGRIRYTPVNDVVINETRAGALERGMEIWLAVEGGVSMYGNTADIVSLDAATVTVDGDSGLKLSKPYKDGRGVFVTVERESTDEAGVITFSGLQISGAVVKGWEYNVIVAGDAVANNWTGSNDENATLSATPVSGTYGNNTLARLHGTFAPEPYATSLFSFGGAEYYDPSALAPAPGTGTTGPGTGTSTGTTGLGPVLLAETMNWVDYSTGEVLAAPIFRTVPTAPGFVSSYVMVRVVADVLGLEWSWDGATRTATFTGRDVVMSLTIDSPVAVVNGTQVPITASGIAVTAQSIDGRLFVPIKFFEEVYAGVKVEWNGVNRTVTIIP